MSSTKRIEIVRVPVFLIMILLFTLSAISPSSYAHDLNFGVLEISEVDSGAFQFDFKYTSKQLDLSELSVRLPPNCERTFSEDVPALKNERRLSWYATCETKDVARNEANTKEAYPKVKLIGLATDQPVLVRFTGASGRFYEQLTRENPISLNNLVSTQQSQSHTTSMLGYLEIGFEHILIGYDHLLVVLCFLMLFKRLGTVLWVVTGFTLGHSFSLLLATATSWQFEDALVEVFILLSVAFMARECYVNSKSSLLYQYPIVMSALIGLLHGLGFANIINQLGLPPNNKLSAILFFNVGVELGQILFVGVGLLILYSVSRLMPYHRQFKKAVSLGIGATSMLWLLQMTQ